ncbi:MAG: hypothetical protein P1R58_06130 [bacterium]|nr:hypothetical protein [bacterium]
MKTDFSLRSLEGLLEAFLERMVHLKHRRLGVLGGINRLDDIARQNDPDEIADEVGDWFAEHNQWLTESVLKPADIDRIGKILGEINGHISAEASSSPAARKVVQEIGRWQEKSGARSSKLVLKRGAETTEDSEEMDTISLFGSSFERCAALFADFSGGKKHLLSVLDDSLKSAVVQKNKQALLLSAYLIYYLKLNGYIVDPFVKRLKAAERLHKEGSTANA